MAEDHVSRDEHRADMAELRSEFKEEIAGLRQEMTVLTKTMKANQQTMLLRFEQVERQRQEDRQVMLQQFQQVDQRHNDLLAMMNQRFDQIDQQRQEDRQAMLQRFDQMDQQRQEDRQAMLQQFQQVDQRFAQHETRLVSLENWMRTTFVTVAVVAVGVAAQLFYTLMRFGLKPPTGGP